MSVCRVDEDSDVYVYYSSSGGIVCCRCSLPGGNEVTAADERKMIAHLDQHKAAGDDEPAKAVERLANPDSDIRISN